MKIFISWIICHCCLLLCIAVPLNAQKAIITEIKELYPGETEVNKFPVIQIPGNKKASFLINQKLREEALYLDSTGYKKSIFEVVRDKHHPNSIGWTYWDFDYQIFANTPKFLNLSILFSGGKHGESQNLNFLFDTRTGEEVSYKKLLTQEGQKWLVEKMVELQKERIQKFLPILKDSIQLPPNPKNPYDSLSKNDFKWEYEIYERCIESNLSFYLSEETSFEFLNWYIKNNELILEGCACAGTWGQQRVDELGNAKLQLPIKEIQRYLTEYGRGLLFGESR